MSDLVGNPEDRFSSVAAQTVMTESEAIHYSNYCEPQRHEASETMDETQLLLDENTDEKPIKIHTPSNDNHAEKKEQFFSEMTITKFAQRPKKKFVTPYAATGSLMKNSITETLTFQANNGKAKQQSNTISPKKQSPQSVNGSKSKTKVKTEPVFEDNSARPGTSGLNKRGGPIDLTYR